FFISSRRRHTRFKCDWSSDVCSSDLSNDFVESYEPGKSIKVTIPGKIVSTKSFDLDDKDTTVNVAPNLKKGDWVSVTERTADNEIGRASCRERGRDKEEGETRTRTRG